MKDQNGNYVATRRMKDTGAVLQGVGSTIESARFALKQEVAKYREAMMFGIYLQATGETFKSPGLAPIKTRSGTMVLRQDDERQMEIKARPDVAKYIKNGRR